MFQAVRVNLYFSISLVLLHINNKREYIESERVAYKRLVASTSLHINCSSRNITNLARGYGSMGVIPKPVHDFQWIYQHSAISSVPLSARCIVQIKSARREAQYGYYDRRFPFVDVERVKFSVAIFVFWIPLPIV